MTFLIRQVRLPIQPSKSRYWRIHDRLVIQCIKCHIHSWVEKEKKSHLWDWIRDEWDVCWSALIQSEPHYCSA